MKIAFATLGLLAFAAGLAAAQDKASIEKALVANERKLNEAVAKGDKATFTSLIAPGAWSADGNGFMKVGDFVAVFDQLKVTSWTISDSTVQWVDDNNAIVLYTWTGAGTFQGHPIPKKVYVSTVWTKKADKWLAAYHQESEASPPAPPPAKKK